MNAPPHRHPVAPPHPMPYRLRLRPYQVQAAAFLAARRAALYAADPGLGKTATALTAADFVGAERVLVVCPASAIAVWEREISKWWPGAPAVRVLRAPIEADPTPQPGIQILSMALLSRRPHEWVSALTPLAPRDAGGLFDLLVVDEAQFCKDRAASRTRAVYGFRTDPTKDPSLAGLARQVWLLSGTPAPNHYAEMWTHLRALAPERILNSRGAPMAYVQFEATVCFTRPAPRGRGRIITGSRNHGWLKAKLDGFMLRHRKDDVARDLPPMSWVPVPVPVETNTDPANAWPAWPGDDRLRLLDTDPVWARQRRALGTAKARAAVPWLVNLLQSGLEKVVVFALHHDALDALQDGLRANGIQGLVRIDGTTPPAARGQLVSSFQDDPSVRVFLGQTLAAGTAITLTAASDVVFIELHTTPGANVQAAQRTHRLGQHRPVTVYTLYAAGTLDERVDEILRTKSQALSLVFDQPTEDHQQ